MTGRRATSFGPHARTHAHGEREREEKGRARERRWTVTQGVVEALVCAARALSVPQ